MPSSFSQRLPFRPPEPVKIENYAEILDHIIGPPLIIHTRSTIQSFHQLRLQVTVDQAGNVESAKALPGEADYAARAESFEINRKFKPFIQDGSPIVVSFEDYVSIFPPEQWSDIAIPFPDIKDWSTLKIRLKRTKCFGPCPAYSIELRGTGKTEFNGAFNVLVTGHHVGTISKQDLESVVAVFRAANYLSLKDEYSYLVTDCPTYISSIEFDGVKKSVRDYVGGQGGMPDVVAAVERAIDHYAATNKWIKGNAQTGPSLLAEKWDFQSNSEENRNLLAKIIATGLPDLVRLFTAKGAPSLEMTKEGASPLVSAAERGNLDLVKSLLRDQPEHPAATMSCALAASSSSGSLQLVQFLIEKGADPNGLPCGQFIEQTVLMNAAKSGKLEIVQEILKYEPDVNAKDREGRTALGKAHLKPGAENILALLISHGADVNTVDDNGQTPLYYACSDAYPDAVRFLIRAGADVNAKDQFGETVLMSCVDLANLKPVIEAGADLTIKNRWGQTAAQAARAMGAKDKADLLDVALKTQPKP